MEKIIDFLTISSKGKDGKRVLAPFFVVLVAMLAVIVVAVLTTKGSASNMADAGIKMFKYFLLVWVLICAIINVFLYIIQRKKLKNPDPEMTAETPLPDDMDDSETIITEETECEVVSGSSNSSIEDAKFEDIQDDEEIIEAPVSNIEKTTTDANIQIHNIAIEVLIKLEENKLITQNPLEWVGPTNLCAYFVDGYFSKSNPNDFWKIGEEIFHVKNLRQSKDGYINNKSGNPKGFAIIDEILQLTK